MNELVTQKQVGNILHIVAIASPITGIVIGTIIGIVKKRILASAARGVLIGHAGVAMFILWKIHISLGQRYGYTSVMSFTVQLVIFFGLGIGIGFLIRRLAGKSHSAAKPKHNRSKLSQEESLNAS
jgi:hypothetical protein